MADLGSIGKLSKTTIPTHGFAISGTVLDASLNPTAHILRAFHDISGERSGGARSSPTTGAYILYTRHDFKTDFHTVVDYDNTGNYNHRILGKV